MVNLPDLCRVDKAHHRDLDSHRTSTDTTRHRGAASSLDSQISSGKGIGVYEERRRLGDLDFYIIAPHIKWSNTDPNLI